MDYFRCELQIYSPEGVSYDQSLAFVFAQFQTLANLSPGLLLKIMNSGKNFLFELRKSLGVEVLNVK